MELKIFNVRTYGIEESIVASGYPMLAEVPNLDTLERYDYLTGERWFAEQTLEPHFKRAVSLGNAPAGSGHDGFLKGIIVQGDFQMPSYWWPQAQRYHWFDIVSSQSKMHRILQMDLEECCCGTVDEVIVESMQIITDHKDGIGDLEKVLANIPMGLELTARVSTNYLQLKTMYSQRKNHRLKCWTEVFCPFVEELPYAKELGITGGKKCQQ